MKRSIHLAPTRRHFMVAILLGVWSLTTTEVSAQENGDTPAQQAFQEARELYQAKRYGEAVNRFAALVQRTQSPNARLYYARCLRALGRIDEAHAELNNTIRDAGERVAEAPHYGKTRDAAAHELAALDPLVGKVKVSVDGWRKGTRLLVSGREVNLDGNPVAVLPGDVKVEAIPPDGHSVVRIVEASAGTTRAVRIALPAVATTDSPVDPAPATIVDESSADGGGLTALQWAGIGVMTLGAGGIAAFAAFSVVADGKLAQLEDECGQARCTDPSFADVVDQGKQAELIGNISIGIGAAALTGGAALLIFGGEADDVVAPSVAITPYGADATLRLRF